MKRILNFILPTFLIISFHRIELKKEVHRDPASVKIREAQAKPEKKARENYSEHLFHQVVESPVKAAEMDY